MSVATLPARAGALLPRLVAWSALIVCETASQAALKAAGERLEGLPLGRAFALAALSEPWVLVGVLGYVGSFIAWMAILDRMPLSRGFPMSSLVAVAIVGASVFVFGEVLDGWRLAGIALILAGLVLMRNDDG